MSLNRMRPTVVSSMPSWAFGLAVGLADDLFDGLVAHVHARMHVHAALAAGHVYLAEAGEALDHLLRLARLDGQVVAAQHDVVRGADDGAAALRGEDVVRGHHQRLGLDLRLHAQRQVHGHRVAVEVGVEALADQRVQADGVALDQDGVEGLDAHAVQGRRAVQQHGVALDDFVEHVPDLVGAPLQLALGALERVGDALLLELADDEGLVEFQGDLLGQAALVELQLGADDDDGAGAVVDALAQQVLAEAALLALDHVRQRLQRPVAAAHDGALAAAVVEERVDRLLQHALLVADDDVGRVQVQQLLQAVVAVDDAAVEVVQVAGGEVAALQQDQRTQLRRDDGDDVQDDPLRLVIAVAQGLRLAELLDDLLAAGLGGAGLQLGAQLGAEGVQVQVFQEGLDGLGAHLGLEAVLAVLHLRLAVLLLAQELLVLQRGVLRVGDGVVLEVDDALQVRALDAEQVGQAAGHALEEPDVDDGRGQVDVAHAVAAHAAVGDLDAAAVADDALVLHAAVLAAAALPVLLRTEYALAEQAVPLGAVGAVVDRLRLGDLAVGPATDVLRGRQGDPNGSVLVDAIVAAVQHLDGPPCSS